ncbi:riboflavin biosynthesis protein RibF [candidate division FCPU426 bacterium]|nr:riboflavin biosynthesis protein RibF [candidate division FCPU426 bacterium]
MKVYRGFPSMKDQGRVITMGVFDGVHRGHAKIVHICRRQARRLGLTAALITFNEHPQGTLAPEKRPPRLATPEQCLNRLQQLGVDEVFLVPFTRFLAHTTAEQFIRRVLVRRLVLRHIVVGRDFVFGRDALGNTAMLRQWGKACHFGVSVVPPLRHRGKIISSSGLRALISRGNVELARAWLGWPYALHGSVVRGEGRGRRIGLPTANLKTIHEVVPAPGTYAVRVYLENMAWPALCHIGKRPTFHPWGPETIEVHIPGWDGNIYRKQLTISFLSRLRGERRFSNATALLRQVRQDFKQALKIWRK